MPRAPRLSPAQESLLDALCASLRRSRAGALVSHWRPVDGRSTAPLQRLGLIEARSRRYLGRGDRPLRRRWYTEARLTPAGIALLTGAPQELRRAS